MLTVLLLCAVCAGQSTKAVSLRQKKSSESERVLSDSLLTPPLAVFFRSEVPKLPPSQVAAKAIETAAVVLEGYVVTRYASTFSCDLWWAAESQRLNLCTKGSDGLYSSLTATSTDEATKREYTDSKCATTPKSVAAIKFESCDLLGISVIYSSTSAPPSSRPFAKIS